MKSKILTDKREISGIYWDNTEEDNFKYEDGYEILAYAEHGPCGPIPYFEVMSDGNVVARVPSWKVTVYYL